MNLSNQKRIDGKSESGEFESTLRLIASLPAPEGLTERVQAGLSAANGASGSRTRVLAWPAALRSQNGWLQSSLARSAAAVAIAAVVVGGGWGVYSRVQPKQLNRAITVSPRIASQGGFSSAGAMRTPQTLNGPEVVHPATIGTQTAKVARKAVTPMPVRRGKSASGKKAAAPATR
ncbi:MAG: hypothetical protein ABSD72_04500 [Terracidiphilus sp.]|jgi:hypothetical protein